MRVDYRKNDLPFLDIPEALPIMHETPAMTLATRWIFAFGMWTALTTGAPAQPAAGNDHVVKPCQAKPLTASFFTPGMTPSDALSKLKAGGALTAKVSAAKAYIVHVTEWADAVPFTAGGTATALGEALHRSTWGAFDANGKLKPVKTDPNGNPILFNQSSVALIGVTHFSKTISPSAVTVGYTISTTPLPKQNVADLVALLSALAGAPPGTGLGKVPINDTYVAGCMIEQDTDLPLTINIGYTVTPVSPPPAVAAVTTTAGVTALPPNVDFGSLTVGTPAGSQTVTVTNKGSGNLTFDTTTGASHNGMVISGPNAADFALSGTDCTATLAPGASCKIFVRFTPSAAGARGATLTLSNDAANSPQTVALTGTGTDPGAAGTAGAKPPKTSKPGGGGGSAEAPSSPKDQPSQGGSTPAPTGAAPTNCTAVTSDAPCSISRSVVDYDKEYWDIGLGLAVPGVPERMYDPADLTKKSSTTVHTDVYAFIDIYFDGNRRSAWPHLVLGVPVASQPLHRQAYAMSFPLTTWLGLSKKVPFTLCGVLGVAAVKEYHLIPDPQGNNGLNLKTGWTAKWFYGVELPLNQLVSRVSKIGK